MVVAFNKHFSTLSFIIVVINGCNAIGAATMYSNSTIPLYSSAHSFTNFGISSFICLPGDRKNGAMTIVLHSEFSINFLNACAIVGSANYMCAASQKYSIPSSSSSLSLQ